MESKETCRHDFEHPLRLGRAHYLCRKCNQDISLEVQLLGETQKQCPKCGELMARTGFGQYDAWFCPHCKV